MQSTNPTAVEVKHFPIDHETSFVQFQVEMSEQDYMLIMGKEE